MDDLVRVAVPVRLFVEMPRAETTNQEKLQQALYQMFDAVADGDDCIGVEGLPGTRLAPDWDFSENIRIL